MIFSVVQYCLLFNSHDSFQSVQCLTMVEEERGLTMTLRGEDPGPRETLLYCLKGINDLNFFD